MFYEMAESDFNFSLFIAVDPDAGLFGERGGSFKERSSAAVWGADAPSSDRHGGGPESRPRDRLREDAGGNPPKLLGRGGKERGPPFAAKRRSLALRD